MKYSVGPAGQSRKEMACEKIHMKKGDAIVIAEVLEWPRNWRMADLTPLTLHADNYPYG